MSATETFDQGAMPTFDPVDSLVEHLRTADVGGQRDRWESADLTLAAIIDKLPQTTAGSGAYQNPESGFWSRPSFNSEASREAVRTITKRLAEEGILVDGREAAERTLLQWAETAYKWPEPERVGTAAFYAHTALNAPKYDGTRRQRLVRLQAKSKTGRVTEPAVRNWIRDQKPAPQQTFLEKVDRRVRLSIKSAAAPWNRVNEDDRMAIARILREIAGEIERGELQ